ncbi:hypothetical protein POTOM_017939 [Populus tomentosa]|uniref:Complex III subunit 9 n=1 Tax=Populus tomentosa TaxID=118781 RepID=A0A8X8A154_POPTO|nr:hypothetical protein POTOM_017939 [Populus tomentosa]
MDDMFNERRGFKGFWALKLREALGGSNENEGGGDEEGFKGFLYAACREEGVRVFQEKSGGKKGVDLERGKEMDYTARRNGGGVFEGLYKLIMRRNSIYVTFVIAGAFAGERAVDYGVCKLWEHNNVGKRYEDIPVLGQRPSE